jgi:hypothetical protein
VERPAALAPTTTVFTRSDMPDDCACDDDGGQGGRRGGEPGGGAERTGAGCHRGAGLGGGRAGDCSAHFTRELVSGSGGNAGSGGALDFVVAEVRSLA